MGKKKLLGTPIDGNSLRLRLYGEIDPDMGYMNRIDRNNAFTLHREIRSDQQKAKSELVGKVIIVGTTECIDNNSYHAFKQLWEETGFYDFQSGRDGTLIIPTLEGDMTAQPCKPDIFEKTYDQAWGT